MQQWFWDGIFTAVASMRQTEALTSIKFEQMPFLHWTYSIRIAPIIKRMVWLRHWDWGRERRGEGIWEK